MYQNIQHLIYMSGTFINIEHVRPPAEDASRPPRRKENNTGNIVKEKKLADLIQIKNNIKAKTAGTRTPLEKSFSLSSFHMCRK